MNLVISPSRRFHIVADEIQMNTNAILRVIIFYLSTSSVGRDRESDFCDDDNSDTVMFFRLRTLDKDKKNKSSDRTNNMTCASI